MGPGACELLQYGGLLHVTYVWAHDLVYQLLCVALLAFTYRMIRGNK